MSLTITGNIMVFRKDFENGAAYSVNVGGKKQDGTFDNAYMTIRFKKGTELNNMTKIDIKDAFFSSYNGKPYIFVKEFEGGLPQGFTEVDDDEIPFG